VEIEILKQRIKAWAKEQRKQKLIRLEKLEEELHVSYQEAFEGVEELRNR
jgi:hypothetical protein